MATVRSTISRPAGTIERSTSPHLGPDSRVFILNKHDGVIREIVADGG